MANRRKTLIVDRRFQYQIVGIVVLCGASTSVIATLGLRLLSTKVLAILEAMGGTDEMKASVLTQFSQMSIQFILLTAVSIGWAWILTIYISNRITGPVRNMMQTLDRHSNGDKEARVKLRARDYFKPLADKINQILEQK